MPKLEKYKNYLAIIKFAYLPEAKNRLQIKNVILENEYNLKIKYLDFSI